MESRLIKDRYRQVTEDQWESTRSDRINSWQSFSKKNDKATTEGAKKTTGLIKPPIVKMEERERNDNLKIYKENIDDKNRGWKFNKERY